jgi:hypothetical protein
MGVGSWIGGGWLIMDGDQCSATFVLSFDLLLVRLLSFV